MSPDVAVIGGGIAGCAVAALLAEAGAAVRLYEREEVAAGASGRNSGILQHPMDPALVGLYEESLELYAGLGHGFSCPEEPCGVIVVSEDAEGLERDRAAAAERFPDLAPEWLEGAALHEAEPALAGDLYAYRLRTGRPVPPAAATKAWAARARAAGAEIVVGDAVEVVRRDGRVAGVRAVDSSAVAGVGLVRPHDRGAAQPTTAVDRRGDHGAGGRGGLEPAGAVVAAAGPWTAEAVGAGPHWQPLVPLWGVVAEVRLAAPPRHSIEQTGVEALTTPGADLAPIFTAVTRDGASTVGSTFTREAPDPAAVAPGLVERGVRFLPALAGAAIESVRACLRPLSADGRPLLGPVPGTDGLHLLTGHGAWGVTLGPASARMVAAGVLGEPVAIPADLAAERFGAL